MKKKKIIINGPTGKTILSETGGPPMSIPMSIAANLARIDKEQIGQIITDEMRAKVESFLSALDIARRTFWQVRDKFNIIDATRMATELARAEELNKQNYVFDLEQKVKTLEARLEKYAKRKPEVPKRKLSRVSREKNLDGRPKIKGRSQRGKR